ncbi:MAG: hypothetical protein ACXW1Z_24250 [Methylobacter sp.]
MHKLEKWNVDDTDWMGLSGFCLVTTYCVTAIKLKNTLVPKLQLGNPVDEAPASRDGKLELPILNSQAGAWELARRERLYSGYYTVCTSKFGFLNLLTPTLSSRRGSKGADF